MFFFKDLIIFEYNIGIKTLELREKINYLGFSPKFNHGSIASRGFQIRKKICNIYFRFRNGGKTLVLRFF